MFVCDQCGLCCKALKNNEIYAHLDRGDGICKHFDNVQHLCTIYDNRPLICQIDNGYAAFFAEQMTVEEYEALNTQACKILKEQERLRMATIEQKIRKKFTEIYGYEGDYKGDKAASNAASVICQGRYKKSEFLDLNDTSIFSNGKSGYVLTTEALCMKDAGNSTSKFIAKYEDIESLDTDQDSLLGVDLTALQIHMKYGETYRFSLGGRDKLKKFLTAVMEILKEEDAIVDEDLVW